MSTNVPSPEIELFLAHRFPLVTEDVAWGELMSMHASAYESHDVPPLSYVTSVRAIVLRDGAVLVQQDRDSRHILPGGRREGGESLERTLRREVGEETGWSLHSLNLLGFIHFRHLDAKPSSYAYPHPDFFQVVYGAQADTFSSEALLDDGYELSSEFVSLAVIDHQALKPIERAFLSVVATAGSAAHPSTA